jgi:phytanoyl-CoA hydroxylase
LAVPSFDPEREQFKREGFVIHRSVHAAPLLERMRGVVERVIDLAEAAPGDVFSNHYLKHRTDQGVLYDLYQRFPEFVDLARSAPVVEAVQALYGPNFFLYENSLVFKPKGRENAVPWHQDFMGYPHQPGKVIAWMALDDVDVENGCMYAIPGSHVRGYLPWYRLRGQTHHTRIRPEFVDDSKAVALEMKAGDVLLFNACLIHSSREVHSARPRRAYRAAYQDFGASELPRGSPIVISLKDPAALKRRYDYEPNKLKWVIHRVGKRLVSW